MRKSNKLDRLRDRIANPAEQDQELACYAAIAKQIIQQRLARNLSQTELAELIGTTQSAVARLESGQRPPRIDTLLRVANALDCELQTNLKPRTIQRRNPSE